MGHIGYRAASPEALERRVAAIKAGLAEIEAEVERGEFDWQPALEDVHMNIEARLREKIGDAAGRLHTARSRNDQVATDFRLFLRDTLDAFDGKLAGLQLSLARKAEAHAGTIMPGFTHLQPAQPVTFGHHLLAYVEMLSRDRGRFQDARRRLNECPLGAAALAGTSFPIDRHMTAKALGFDGKGCIHPRQIQVIHEAFAPTAQELEKAQRIVAAFEEAEAKGLAAVSLGSKMIDPPVVKRALRTVALAVASGVLPEDWREKGGDDA